MKRITLVIVLVVFSLLFIAGAQAKKKKSAVPKDCPKQGSAFEIPIQTMPFPDPTPRAIDSLCPRAGNSKPKSDHGIQNAVKNDFTVKGTPVELTFSDFGELQKATDKKIGDGIIKILAEGFPANRATSLQNQISLHGKSIGEGTPATLEAYIYSAHYSNTKFNRYKHNKRGSGEANNCKCNRVDWNDIHIALVEKVNDGECNSVTAEISPHYRSVIWSRFHDGRISEIQQDLPGLLRHKVILGKVSGDKPIKVRITGPLFYDASHAPCKFNSAGAVVQFNSPARRTIWEIHPIYRIQMRDEANNTWVDLK